MLGLYHFEICHLIGHLALVMASLRSVSEFLSA